jgi:hypothetical protein
MITGLSCCHLRLMPLSCLQACSTLKQPSLVNKGTDNNEAFKFLNAEEPESASSSDKESHERVKGTSREGKI